MSDRKHADLWKELVDEAGEAEIDRAASVSVEQAEAELAAAGFDVAAERARANAFLEALQRGESTSTATPTPKRPAPDAPEPKRRVRPRDVVFRVAQLAASAAAGAALYAGLQQAPGVGQPPPEGPDHGLASDLRRQAAASCEAKQWSVCLADLDKARAIDPRGDDAPTVKALRDQAILAILSQPR